MPTGIGPYHECEEFHTVGHVKDGAELYALRKIEDVLAIDQRDRDALPGTVVNLLKQARTVLRKRQEAKRRGGRRGI